MDDYSTEPKVTFKPLDSGRYAELYHMEMKDKVDDIEFYTKILPPNSKVLELGCGTGRIANALSKKGFDVVGLDISEFMLDLARSASDTVKYLQGDMTNFSLTDRFKAILIPYNTLNLIPDMASVKKCLSCINKHLSMDGLLVAQIHIPSNNLIQLDGKRLFQFQSFNTPTGGKIIKESLRKYLNANQKILLEERYRVRPMVENSINEDLSHTITLLGYAAPTWLRLFSDYNLEVTHIYGDYALTAFDEGGDSNLLVVARKKVN